MSKTNVCTQTSEGDMKRSKLIFKTIDNMTIKELKVCLKSNIQEFESYKNYIRNKIDEKTIQMKYLAA